MEFTLNKILNFLLNKEGFTYEKQVNEAVYVQDVFGNRYRISIEVLGRNVGYLPMSQEILNAKESIGLTNLDFNEKSKHG